MTLISGLVLIGLSLGNQWTSRSAFAAAMHCTEDLEVQTQQYLNRAMLIRALGMQSTTLTRQHRLQHAAQVAQLRASDIAGLFTTIIRTLRMAMQSAILGLGAWLVLQEQLSAGGMIATSILFGRLLNPLEVLIGSWIVPQRALLGWARALFGDPVLLVLDEPNSNLDNEGVAALNAAVRRFKRKGNTVLIIAHRPAAIQECDTLMVIESGQITAFGPKEDILRKMVKNHADISIPPAGGSAPHGV